MRRQHRRRGSFANDFEFCLLIAHRVTTSSVRTSNDGTVNATQRERLVAVELRAQRHVHVDAVVGQQQQQQLHSQLHSLAEFSQPLNGVVFVIGRHRKQKTHKYHRCHISFHIRPQTRANVRTIIPFDLCAILFVCYVFEKHNDISRTNDGSSSRKSF